MSTYSQLLYQIVFGSKDYNPFISPENANTLYAYISGVLKNKNCHSYIVGGSSNHIHIITHIHPMVAPAYLIKDLKMASHEMMRQDRRKYSRFAGWQVGYGLFTYHISAKDNLISYVVNQDIHHKNITYKEELISLLQEHLTDYSEEYLLT